MEQNALKEQLRERFGAFIRSKGMRQTQERFTILDKIVELPAHFDIEDLYKDIEENYHVSLATVYNTIDLLCEAGILRKHFLNGNQAAYELSDDNHLHLICQICGEVREEHTDTPLLSRENLKFRRFTMTYAAVNIYGVCAKCLAKKRKKDKTEKPDNKTNKKTK